MNKIDIIRSCCCIITAFLSLILAFFEYTKGLIPLAIIWTINSVINITLAYSYNNQD